MIFQGATESDFLGLGTGGSVMGWNGPPGGGGLWDANGDGVSDIAIGATNAPGGNQRPTGAVYLFYGGPAMSGQINAVDSARVFLGMGILDLFGISIEMAGDFNNDGRPDLLIGSNLNDNNGFTDNGLAKLQLFK